MSERMSDGRFEELARELTTKDWWPSIERCAEMIAEARRARAAEAVMRDILVRFLSDEDAIECQECGIGHSRAWKKAIAVLKDTAPKKPAE